MARLISNLYPARLAPGTLKYFIATFTALAIVVVVIWNHTYHTRLILGDRSPPRSIRFIGYHWRFVLADGAIFLSWMEKNYSGKLASSAYAAAEPSFLGFGMVRAPSGATAPGQKRPWASQGAIRAPIGFFAVLLVLPVLGAALILRRQGRDQRRRQNHLCVECGYDLRASPERCPECGSFGSEAYFDQQRYQRLVHPPDTIK